MERNWCEFFSVSLRLFPLSDLVPGEFRNLFTGC